LIGQAAGSEGAARGGVPTGGAVRWITWDNAIMTKAGYMTLRSVATEALMWTALGRL